MKSAAAAFLLLAAAPLFAQSPAKDVDVRTSLDRTAVWVGDRVTYTIAVVCRNGVDILADDLSRDKLRLGGLDVVSADSERTAESDDATRYRFRYVLTTYRVDVPSLTIAPLSVRYYVRRAGQRVEDTAPAGEVQVPGAAIGLRSVLPDDPATYALRDGRPPVPRQRRFTMLPAVGAGLVLVSIVPAALFVGAVAVQAVRRRARRTPRRSRVDRRSALDTLRSLDITAPEARRDAYSRLNALLREHAAARAGIPAAAMTSEEIGAAVAARSAPVPGETIVSLVAACEEARYAPLDAVPSEQACRRDIDRAVDLLGARP
jgi:Domain of unknown function (DUF4381)